MLKSMTGYGEANRDTEGFVFSVEIKCVNNKFLKITSKVPEEISYLQNELEEPVRKFLKRGSVYITAKFAPTTNADLYEIDEDVLEKYLKAVRSLDKRLGDGGQTDGSQSGATALSLKDLLVLPGVINTEMGPQLTREQVLPVTLEVLDKALGQVVQMREREGAVLEKEFHERGKHSRTLIDEIKRIYPEALQQHHKRLRERVNNLLNGTERSVSEDDLVKEIAILAERSDISEELSRMESHLELFEDCLSLQEPVGRRLEFVVQEMFRECNTMGSKSVDSALNRCVVELKAEVTRLKEQVLNVE